MSLKCKGLFIVGAKRTPFCKHGGPLRELPASYAFAAAAKDAIKTANVDPLTIDSTIVGNVHFLSQCDGGKTPRYCGIYSGVPIEKPALGVNKACATGIQAVINSGVEILTGLSKMTLTGGTEIMSALPFVVRNVRFGTALGGNYQFEDYLKKEIQDSYCGKTFQTMNEELAKKRGVTREDADEFALNSRLKFINAQKSKVFDPEITTLTVEVKRKDILVDKDDPSNTDPSKEELANLQPISQSGNVATAENSFQASDGAAAIILANEDIVHRQNLKPLARVSGWTSVGVDPEEFGLGASVAVQRLLKQQDLRVDDVDLFELNETFASIALITMKQLNVDPRKVNVDGGALALGHPIAATGARMVAHLAHLISQGKARKAVAASSCGGGQGVAILLEKV